AAADEAGRARTGVAVVGGAGAAGGETAFFVERLAVLLAAVGIADVDAGACAAGAIEQKGEQRGEQGCQPESSHAPGHSIARAGGSAAQVRVTAGVDLRILMRTRHF